MYYRVDGYVVKIKGEYGLFVVFQNSLYLTYILPNGNQSTIKKLLLEIVEQKNGTLDIASVIFVKEANIVRFDYIVVGAISQRFSAFIYLIPLTKFK
jgi:hypothetical protein